MKNIRLRAPELEDIELLYKWENDTSIWHNGCTIAPYSINQLTDYITSYDGDIYSAKQLRMMIDDCDTGVTVGSIDIYDYDPVNNRAFIGYLIDDKYRNMGYASSAIIKTAEYCRNRLSMRQLLAISSIDNAESLSVLLKCGFTECGMLKQWIKRERDLYVDALMMQLFLFEKP